MSKFNRPEACHITYCRTVFLSNCGSTPSVFNLSYTGKDYYDANDFHLNIPSELLIAFEMKK
jgi:hypothetical protein